MPKNVSRSPTFIEVCAGCGGLSSGLIEAGFKPLLLNDNNKACCDTLKMNHPGVKVECCSMEKLDITKYIDKVDLFTGGVPCQSFSQAGLRKGLNDSRGELMFKFIEMVNIIKPKVFMIENVKGLVNHNKGKTIINIITKMKESGLYEINYKVLNSFDYNVPQKRERIFIIGILNTNTKKFEFPKPLETKKYLKDVLYDVPSSPCAQYNQTKIDLFKQIPQGGCWINLPIDLQKSYLKKSFDSTGGKRGILHRLSMEKPCLTLLCTPSQKQTERCHPLEERPLSVREYARIQTFKDNFIFTGSISSQYKQIGNAVPVELAKHIGESIKTVLVI